VTVSPDEGRQVAFVGDCLETLGHDDILEGIASVVSVHGAPQPTMCIEIDAHDE